MDDPFSSKDFAFDAGASAALGLMDLCSSPVEN
jgi:hypothetical protein